MVKLNNFDTCCTGVELPILRTMPWGLGGEQKQVCLWCSWHLRSQFPGNESWWTLCNSLFCNFYIFYLLPEAKVQGASNMYIYIQKIIYWLAFIPFSANKMQSGHMISSPFYKWIYIYIYTVYIYIEYIYSSKKQIPTYPPHCVGIGAKPINQQLASTKRKQFPLKLNAQNGFNETLEEKLDFLKKKCTSSPIISYLNLFFCNQISSVATKKKHLYRDMSFFSPKLLRLLSQSQALLCKVMSQTKFARLATKSAAAMFFNEVFFKVGIHLKITGGTITDWSKQSKHILEIVGKGATKKRGFFLASGAPLQQKSNFSGGSNPKTNGLFKLEVCHAHFSRYVNIKETV